MYLVATYDKTLKCYEDDTKNWAIFSDWDKADKYRNLMNEREILLTETYAVDDLDIFYTIVTILNEV